MVRLDKYFGSVCMDDNGTLHLGEPLHVEDQFGALLEECKMHTKKSDLAIGKLMSMFGDVDVQVRFDDKVYPEPIIVNVLSNVINKPFVPGEGIGLHENLGIKKAVQIYVRGLDDKQKLFMAKNGIDVDSGRFECDISDIPNLLKKVEEMTHYGVIIEFTSSRKERTDDELKEMFNEHAAELTVDDSCGISCKVFPMKDVKCDGEHVTFEFEAQASIFDCVSSGAISATGMKLIQLMDQSKVDEASEIDPITIESLLNGDEKAICKEYAPKTTKSIKIEGESCVWVEQHCVSMEMYRMYMNDPLLSPNSVKVFV